MKRYILLSLILCIMMIMTPLISVNYIRVKDESGIIQEAETLPKDETIQVMQCESGNVISVSTREYIIGSVAGEMSPEYHQEALKAQAVASYTFALYITKRDSGKNLGYDISDDSSVYQSYIDQNKRKEKWGEKYEEYEKAIETAVDSVIGKKIVYNGEPIMAVYFDKCYGKTESAENIWGKKTDYLVSVTSDGDKLAPDAQSEKIFTEKEFKKALESKNIKFTDNSEKWIGEIKRYDSGVVENIKISGTEIIGTQFRTLLSLKSADFNIKYKDGKFTVTCYGNGHFVGMSQYGADYMARQGETYDKILQHYYKNTQII